MTVKIDPERNETHALFKLSDFTGKHVLEVGCGDGRLTRRYAGRAAQVTAIDPFADGIRRAKENLPDDLSPRVEFRNISLEGFADTSEPPVFDTVLLSWSL